MVGGGCSCLALSVCFYLGQNCGCGEGMKQQHEGFFVNIHILHEMTSTSMFMKKY